MPRSTGKYTLRDVRWLAKRLRLLFGLDLLVGELQHRRAFWPLEVELPAGQQHGIANLLGVEPPPLHPPQEPVARVDRVIVGVVLAAQLIHAAQYDRSNQLLDRPVVVHELHGQRVEQVLVARFVSQGTEVIDRIDEPLPEEMLPHAIHDDACREGVVLAGDPMRQLQSAAAAWIDMRRLRRLQHGQHATRNLGTLVLELAAHEHVAVGW